MAHGIVHGIAHVIDDHRHRHRQVARVEEDLQVPAHLAGELLVGLDVGETDAAADEEAVDGPAGEEAALERWRTFLDDDLADYGTARDRPDLDATSRMSVHLAHGEIHPRTMLADLAAHPDGGSEGAQRFVTNGDDDDGGIRV